MDLDSVVPTQEALLGGIHVWRLHDHAEQLAAVRLDSDLGSCCCTSARGHSILSPVLLEQNLAVSPPSTRAAIVLGLGAADALSLSLARNVL